MLVLGAVNVVKTIFGMPPVLICQYNTGRKEMHDGQGI